MLRPEFASALLGIAHGRPPHLADAVAQALSPIIVTARGMGRLDQANYISEIQKTIELRYPHRRFSGVHTE